ncbi:MAG: VOC family protein [Pseudomonadota bacterium]
MISYITIGVDDIEQAERFYMAFLPDLGYRLEFYHGDLSFVLPEKPRQPEFYVKRPFDGHPASAGNGTMVAFQARNQQQVRDLHAAALAAGGSDDGPPGFRANYGPNFYVAYLRDPQGNKLALYSSNPNEPVREG